MLILPLLFVSSNVPVTVQYIFKNGFPYTQQMLLVVKISHNFHVYAFYFQLFFFCQAFVNNSVSPFSRGLFRGQ